MSGQPGVAGTLLCPADLGGISSGTEQGFCFEVPCKNSKTRHSTTASRGCLQSATAKAAGPGGVAVGAAHAAGSGRPSERARAAPRRPHELPWEQADPPVNPAVSPFRSWPRPPGADAGLPGLPEHQR